MPVPLVLKIYKGDLLVGTKEFSRDIIKIGRLSSAHLSLEDDRISRIHSVIQITADSQISILDMGSAEGTFVNGKRVSKGALANGDEITLGNTRLVLELGSVPPVPATTSPSGPPAPPAGAVPLPGPSPSSWAGAPSGPPLAFGQVDGNTALASAPQPSVVAMAAPAAAPAFDLQSDRPVVFGRRRRTAGALADIQLSRRGLGAVSASSDDSTDEGIELRVFWGDTLIGSVLRTRPSQITIGEDERADVVVATDGLPEKLFVAARTLPNKQVEVRFTKAMEGEFQIHQQPPVRLSELVVRGQARADGTGYALVVPNGGLVWMSLGNLRVEIERRHIPRKVIAPFWEGFDFRFLNLTLLMGIAMLAFIISAATFPLDTDTTADDLFRNNAGSLKFVVKPPDKVRNPFLDKLKSDAEKGQEKGDQGEKRAGAEGKAGKRAAPVSKNKSAPRAIDINAKEVVKNSALIKALGASGGLSTIFGNGGLGGDLKGAIGNMFGPAIGDAQGLGGLGLRGTGQGGGGVGNTIGIGDIGTKGRGGGLGGYGLGVGALGKKSGSDVAISSGNPVIEGSMDKELIRRVIHEHRNQVRYCYESELQRHPGLSGKVTVKFVIASNGTVQKSGIDNSSLGNAAVENCIVARIYQWQFPKPKGGGIVQVSYPFLLKESGE